mgnify:FL=1
MSGGDKGAPGEPSIDTVREAATRLAGRANRTPVLTSRTLDERVGGSVFLKCESFQRSGSFKFRGAYNAASQLSEEERSCGILTFSSGNHAQAMALAGKLLGIAVTVVMPNNAPLSKRRATEGYGAEVILYDPLKRSREEIARRLKWERGSALIPPFDHPNIIAGAGTAALELFDEVEGIDLLLVQCGGGGLLSGSAIAATAAGARVIGVEPRLADDATRTFRTGTMQTIRNPPTIADGLRTPSLGEITWPIIRHRVSDMVTVEESSILDTMHFLWTRMKIVVEPSGAVALSALFEKVVSAEGLRVGVIVSGGNVDLDAACGMLGGR